MPQPKSHPVKLPKKRKKKEKERRRQKKETHLTLVIYNIT